MGSNNSVHDASAEQMFAAERPVGATGQWRAILLAGTYALALVFTAVGVGPLAAAPGVSVVSGAAARP